MAITITTTGATFSPVIALVGGSLATVTWSCPTFTTQNGLTPSFAFGSAATRTVTMTVTGGGGYADVTLFNLGYDNTIDVGTFMPSSGFVKSAELVTGGIGGLNAMTGLIYFLADHTALNSSLDFTSMSALQFIQCYGTGVTGVTLTGCTALIRLQVEAANLTTLDLNPVAGNLKDLRAAVQQGGTLTFATLTQNMAALYHYCVRQQAVVNSVPFSQLPVLNQYWTWQDGLSGALTPSSNALNWVDSHGNGWTSADFTNQLTSASSQVILNDCQLTAVNLAGCTGLQTANLSHNRLQRPAVDSILATVAGFGTSGGTLNLSGNTAPSSAGRVNVNALTGRGWTVTVDSPAAISVAQTLAAGSTAQNFASPVGLGDTVFIVVCAYTTSGASITSSNPQYNAAAPPGGSVKLQEVISPLKGAFGVYHAIWMMPACGDGSHPGINLTVTGATGIGAYYAFDVAGLGVAPALDQASQGSNATTSAVDSGPARIAYSPEFILAASQVFDGSTTPGAPWTVGSSPGGQTGWAGYQIAAAPGGVYDWAQTAAAGSDPWTAGVVAVRATGANGPQVVMGSLP